MKQTTLLCIVAFALLTFGQSRASATLYGATGGVSAGSLYTIDPVTGAATLVGPLVDSSANAYALTGLAFDSVTGVLYGSTTNNSPTAPLDLVSVDPSTGLVTPIGGFQSPGAMADLTFNSMNSTLYGTDTSGRLYTINQSTGLASNVGPATTGGGNGDGLAANAAGVLYGTPNGEAGNLVIYNPSTGADPVSQALTGGPYGSFGGIGALAFSSSSVLYGADIDHNKPTRVASLITIDLNTGAITDIGATVPALDAIAFTPVPEPATWMAAALPLAYLISRLVRRSQDRRAGFFS